MLHPPCFLFECLEGVVIEESLGGRDTQIGAPNVEEDRGLNLGGGEGGKY